MERAQYFLSVASLLTLAWMGEPSAGSLGAGVQDLQAPEFIGTQQDWINSTPLTIKSLRGKVVLIDFWEYTCVNCIRTFPYLKAWNDRYRKYGLVIVGIHTPEFQFAHQTVNVVRAAKEFGLDFPLLIDSDYRNWNAYGNQCWPRKYLIDQQGNVVFDHSGEGGYGDFEKRIQELLLQQNPNLQLPPIMAPVRGEDVPGAVCHPITREMYAGSRGASVGQFPGGKVALDKPVRYAIPGQIAEGEFYLGGEWSASEEHFDATRAGSSLAIRYRAKECNAVLRRTGPPVVVDVYQDGKPVARGDAGSDIRYEGNQSVVTVDSPRMYVLTKNSQWGAHRLTIVARSPGFQIYSFAFTSDCVAK